MSFLRHFFQKRQPALKLLRIEQEQRMRMNPLLGFGPDTLVAAIDRFRLGGIGNLSRIIDELETRDDMMCGCARKMRASVGRCPHQILICEGYENEPEAKRHQQILTKFWANVQVTSAFSRNERGGTRLLKKQMMAAASRVYNVHEVIWLPQPDGSISAKFIQIPNWFFENRTGELRFLREVGMIDGIEMPAGEWLVTVGDGIGIAASVLAMAKSLSRNDWLLFSERCGQPGLHLQTDAAEGTDPWHRLVRSVRSFGREWSLISDNQTKLTPVNLNVGAQLPYPPLIEVCNKGIAALYRGSDLSTISGESAQSTGASVQGDETDILEQDACEMISETLNAQIDRYVIRYCTGSDVPLAYISVSPSDRPNVDQDTKIDTHLVSMGVKLSKNDALARYGRSEHDAKDSSDTALMMPAQPFASLANDGSSVYRVAPLLQNAPDTKDGTTDGLANEAPQNDATALLEAFAGDMGPIADAVTHLLAINDLDARQAAAAQLADDLPALLPADPEMAAVLEAALAEAFAVAAENENPNKAADGTFASGGGDQTGGGARPREPKTREQSDSLGKRYDPEHPEQYGPADNFKRGSAAVNRAMRQKADVKQAMFTPECGAIDFDWGTPGDKANDYAGGWGISHIAAKHPEATQALPEILAKGVTHQLPRTSGADGKGDAIRYAVVHNDHVAFLDKRGKGASFAVTAFTKDPAALASVTKNPLAKPRGS